MILRLSKLKDSETLRLVYLFPGSSTVDPSSPLSIVSTRIREDSIKSFETTDMSIQTQILSDIQSSFTSRTSSSDFGNTSNRLSSKTTAYEETETENAQSTFVGNTITKHPLNTFDISHESDITQTVSFSSIKSESIAEKAEEYARVLRMDTKSTALYKRKKSSAKDKRLSAYVAGSIGAIIIAVPLVMIIISDLKKILWGIWSYDTIFNRKQV